MGKKQAWGTGKNSHKWVHHAKRRQRKVSKDQFVYGLYTGDYLIRYIGQTNNPGERYLRHTAFLTKAKSSKLLYAWLIRNKGNVGMVIFPQRLDLGMDEYERRMIDEYRERKFPLFNIYEGGLVTRPGTTLHERYVQLREFWETCDPPPDDKDFELLDTLIDQFRGMRVF